MKNFTIILFTLTVLFYSLRPAIAQNFNYETMERPWSIEAGVGPGWMYADNAGSIRRIGFALTPAASLSLTKNINAPFSLRTTLGFQGMEGNLDASMDRKMQLGDEGNAYDFRGQLYYFDVAPVFRLFRFRETVHRRRLNLYASTGIGGMAIFSTNDMMVESTSIRRENNKFIPYIPLRAGISYRFRPLWDLSLEGSLLFTFDDDIDGHRGSNHLDDYPMGIQIKIRKFFTFKMVNSLLNNPTY
ncbi:DUF6089 family protein [Anditalea andensis]|uniref:DUF6089 domain-containing protein n=1 Tax=Anditalea andensis TaxID=1048983 RepID=A0A074LI62_9BACT|nr:DUF6089 family protein [Anditalea andensis]KEO73477.1 hypothetical protein EL17_11260 [Anditalea andensis]